MRIDHLIIDSWIKPKAKVLDLGCGDGTLLHQLRERKDIRGYGVEIDPAGIQKCVEKRVNVIEKNLDTDLGNFDDKSFDTVIMSQTLQTMQHPEKTLEDMLRIGKEGIVTFPNFAHWKARFHLMFNGRMPVSDLLPYEWYNTPNIHFCTFIDFETLCKDMDINIINHLVASEDTISNSLSRFAPNYFGEFGIYRITK